MIWRWEVRTLRRKLDFNTPLKRLPQQDGLPTGRVAQLAEHSTLNRQVEGSIPSASTISKRPTVNQISIKGVTSTKQRFCECAQKCARLVKPLAAACAPFSLDFAR